MDVEIQEYLTVVTTALQYMKVPAEKVGSEMVKQAAKDTYEWLRKKLSPKGTTFLDQLKDNPGDQVLLSKIQSQIEAAIELEKVTPSDLTSQTRRLMNLLKENDSNWYTENQTTIQHTMQKITGNDNTVISNTSGSNIHINKGQ